jgi:DNA-binding transcriptional regulator YhcF (GntR family)
VWFFILWLIFEVIAAGLFPFIASVLAGFLTLRGPVSVGSIFAVVRPFDIVALCAVLAFSSIPGLLEHPSASETMQTIRQVTILQLIIIGLAGPLMVATDKDTHQLLPSSIPDLLNWPLAAVFALFTIIPISLVWAMRAAEEISDDHGDGNGEQQQLNSADHPNKAPFNDKLIGPVPLYKQLATLLRQDIEAGRITERLPSQPALTRRYGVGRSTVHRAVQDLTEGGYVRISRGQGTFVTPASERGKAEPAPEVSVTIDQSPRQRFT